MNNGDWTFNNREEDCWPHDHFKTKEEAMTAGIEYAMSEKWSSLFVGQIQEIPVVSPIDADEIIGNTAQRIDDDYGGDYEPGQSFLNDISDGDSERLQELLDEAFYKWADERNIKCSCFTIEKIERVPIAEVPK